MLKSAIYLKNVRSWLHIRCPLPIYHLHILSKVFVKQRRGDDSYKDDALEDLVPQLVRKHGGFDSHQRQSSGVMEVDKNNEASRSTDT